MNLLNVAYYLPKLALVLGGQIAREEEWDFLKNGSYGVQHLVYASSSSVYGSNKKTQRIWNGCVK